MLDQTRIKRNLDIFYNLLEIWDGDWINYCENGLFYHYKAGHEIYQGEMDDYLHEGKGTMIHPVGIRVSGDYSSDNLQGKAIFTDLEGNEKELEIDR